MNLPQVLKRAEKEKISVLARHLKVSLKIKVMFCGCTTLYIVQPSPTHAVIAHTIYATPLQIPTATHGEHPTNLQAVIVQLEKPTEYPTNYGEHPTNI